MNSPALQNLDRAFSRAEQLRPQSGGFPILAEVLRQAGVRRNIWHLPSAQSIYETDLGNLVQQGEPLFQGLCEVPAYDEQALVAAIRRDQAGEGTFPEFLSSVWGAGVICYVVDFSARTCLYCGIDQEYLEEYEEAIIPE